MKYVSVVATIIVLLAGCASNGGRGQWNYDGSEKVALLNTEQYLPVREKDETGALLPYEATTNPYAELKGRVDKQAVTQYIEARRAFNAEQFQRADEILQAIVKEERSLSGPWVMRGDIAMQQDHTETALEYYAKAIDINNVNINAYLRLAVAQREQGLFSHAQNTYARALALWPDAPEAHLNLAILYDIYLNDAHQAQAHMEAYLFLHKEPSEDVATWLSEVRSRTGLASLLKFRNAEGELQYLSIEPAKGTLATEDRPHRSFVASDTE